MATKSVAVTVTAQNILFVDWGSIPSGDTGQAFANPDFPRKTIQRYAGTGTVSVTGSMDGITFGNLHDITGTDLSLADAEPRMILENPVYIQVTVATNAASVAIVGAK